MAKDKIARFGVSLASLARWS